MSSPFPSLAAPPAATLAEVLVAPAPASELAAAPDLYSFLIGSWDVEVIDDPHGPSPRRSRGEWHFGWALEGRAVIDVFIVPARDQRGGELPREGNRYGASTRVYDPALDAWRVTWINPVTAVETRLVARREGADVVQLGRDHDGDEIRWSFTEIRPDSCLWRGEVRVPAPASAADAGGLEWRTQAVFHLRRRAEG